MSANQVSDKGERPQDTETLKKTILSMETLEPTTFELFPLCPEPKSLSEMERLPWYEEVHALGIPIENIGRHSQPMCPEHGPVWMRKFGRYRWGCVHGLIKHQNLHSKTDAFIVDMRKNNPDLLEKWIRENRTWENCHWKVEYKPEKGGSE